MPGSLQHRLERHEEMPPPSAWNNISRRLDEEFQHTDHGVSIKLEEAAIAPPAAVWNEIISELQADVPVEITPTKKIPLFRRLAAAAVIAAMLAVGAMYFFTGKNSNDRYTGSTATSTLNNDPVVDDSAERPSPRTALPATDSGIRERVMIASNHPKRSVTSRSRQIARVNQDLTAEADTYFSREIEEAPVFTLEPVRALNTISVSAPPIRDDNGNIIMNLSLISEPGNPYITVTGPNGDQTRISSKFLHCLSYINGNFNAADMNGDAMDCKTRFEEWRKKLLSDAAFIPTANNFFDIFELKEMIQTD